VLFKTRLELRSQNNEEKKHRRVPACNLQPSQFNFDRGLQYEYQKTSNLNIHQIFNNQHNCEIGRHLIICAPRIFDDFWVQILKFLSNYTYF